MGGITAHRSAFTLIEVLVVVAIIALMVAVLLPSLSQARASARASICMSNLHQFNIAIQTYESEYKGYIPRGGNHATITHWVMLVVRQLGDRSKFTHVNQVPVGKHPVYSCPQRSSYYGGGFIDYVLNTFDSEGARVGWAEVAEPRPPHEWRYPSEVLLLGDAALEVGTCGEGANTNGELLTNRLNHPQSQQLTDLSGYVHEQHASLDRMDLYLPEHVPSECTRRAGTTIHMNRFCNWLYADGHIERVPWLHGKRSRTKWLTMFGVEHPL